MVQQLGLAGKIQEAQQLQPEGWTQQLSIGFSSFCVLLVFTRLLQQHAFVQGPAYLRLHYC